MRNLILLSLLVSALLCGGCSSLYKSTVTLTEVVDGGMKNWASLSVRGQTTPAIDAKIKSFHGDYTRAAAIARDALIAYKASGDKAKYEQALIAVKAAVNGIVDVITPLLASDLANSLKSQALKASTL